MRIYTVALHEVPRPAERPEVSFYAAGPADALVKAGQMFSETERPRAPFAWLEIIGVEPAGPMRPTWSEHERVELVDE